MLLGIPGGYSNRNQTPIAYGSLRSRPLGPSGHSPTGGGEILKRRRDSVPRSTAPTSSSVTSRREESRRGGATQYQVLSTRYSWLGLGPNQENELPQPQAWVLFGFSMANPAPISPSR